MIIDASREPRLQLDDAEPFAIESCEVKRDIERSTLTNVVRDGAPLRLPPGAHVILWAGDNVVFEGRAIDDGSVLDLLSCQSDDELGADEII